MMNFDEFEFDCPPDIVRMKLLSDITFGDGYISQIELEHYIKNPDKFIVTTICHKGNIIGYSIQEIIDAQLTGINKEIKTHLHQLKPNSPWIFRKHTLLAKAYRGIGLGTKLLEASEKKVKKTGLPSFSLVWDYAENGIKQKLKEHKYKEIAAFNNYWYQESLDNKFQCTVCGSPCRCKAVLMARV